MEYKTIRKSLKNNFLKNLIFRLDFSGMMDADVEDFIKSIRDKIHINLLNIRIYFLFYYK